MMSDRSDAVPHQQEADETDPYVGAIALAAFNGAAVGAAGCAAELFLRDVGTALIAGLGAMACLAIWHRQLLGADGTERR